MTFLSVFTGNKPTFEWRSAGATDVGKVRAMNEDRYLDLPSRCLWAVADGVGGHEAGEIAAQEVVDGLNRLGAPRKINNVSGLVAGSLQRSNQTIRDLAASRGKDVVIGSTVVAAVARGTWLTCLWAGDSRLYRLRAGQLVQLTRDHDLLTEMNERNAPPELVEAAKRGNVITRAVGVADQLDLEELKVGVESNDTFLICSDGLYKELDPPTIAALMRELEPTRAVDRLMQSALAAGARDNTTVVVMRATSPKQGGGR